MVKILKYFLFIYLILLTASAKELNLQENCTYENEHLWIKIIPLCSEGDLSCQRVVYIGLNKNTNKYIALKGKSLIDINQNFTGYEFKNKNFIYTIRKDSILYIEKDNKILQTQKLNLCE